MADFIPRAITGTVLKDTPPEAAVIIGPRGCGKTTFLTEIVKQCPGEAKWFNCDLSSAAEKIRFVSRGDAENFLRLAPTIVLEEVQRVPDIGLMLKILVDLNERREKPARLFVSASTSLVLAPGIQESAVGRIRERPIWPFSMAEIASHRYPGFVQDNLDTFLVYGSSPCAVEDFDAAADFLTDFYQGLLFKDLFSLTEIRKPQALTALATALAKRIGEPLTFESLGRELGLSKNTAERYTYLLELAGIVRVLPSYTGVLTNELKKGKKVYFTDVGVRNALIGDFSPFSTRADAAALWENFFFMERVKLHDAARDRKRLFFWRTKGTRPHTVDFLERRDGKLEAFVCRLSGDNAATDPVFSAAYPEVPVHVVTPRNCLPFLGITAAGPASGS